MENKLLMPEAQFTQMKSYWLSNLNGSKGNTHVFENLNRMTNSKKSKCEFTVNEELVLKLNNISAGKETVLFVILLAAFNVLLYKMTGNEDIVISSPTYKYSDELDNYNRIIPFRQKLEENITIGKLLTCVSQIVAEGYANQYYSMEKVFKELGLNEDGLDFASILIVFENIHKNEHVEDIIYSLYNDLTFSFDKANEVVNFNIIFNSALFGEEEIRNIAGYYLNVLGCLVNSKDMSLAEVSLLTEEEKKYILYEFNNTDIKYPDKTIFTLFEEQVAKEPNRTAIISENKEITYSGLNKKANQLARLLRNRGVRTESIVGLMTRNSVEAVIGIIAVLKAGGAYLPIDPNYPAERISHLIEDSGVLIILVDNDIKVECEFSGEIINLSNNIIYTGDDTNLEVINNSMNLAYIIYTSGSTGNPKGTLIEHKSLVNYVLWAKQMYIKDINEKFALYSSLSFDLTVTSIFTPLISGNCIIVYNDDGTKFILHRIICENKVNIIKLTPSHLLLLKELNLNNSAVKRFIVGGEDLKAGLVEDICKCFGRDVEIYNEYGPTEATVGCMIYKYSPMKDRRLSVPIGIPISNTQIYLLDEKLRPISYGSIGEIYISGDGVARGYLNKDELTKDRFLKSPFIKGKRLYKTGDLARWIKCRIIEYIGRNDSQVKINGHRVELGELQKALAGYPGIKDAVILDVADENNSKYLCAYLATDTVGNEEIITIKGYLVKMLPKYMVPSHIILLDKIPLNVNGKVDRDLLLTYCKTSYKADNYLPPGNETEKILAEIWQRVLKVEKIGISDNFFHIGGDSVKAILIIGQLQKHHLSLELRDIFEYPTIMELSLHVKQSRLRLQGEDVLSGEVVLTPIQRYFFEQNNININHYNQSIVLYKKDKFDDIILKKVFTKLVERHDMLRAMYKVDKSEFVQIVRTLEDNLFEFNIIELEECEDYIDKVQKESDKIQASIDIENGPLLKIGLFKTNSGDFLSVIIHHLVIDAVSLRIFINDFNSAYLQAMNNKEIEFYEKSSSFMRWVEELKDYSESRELMKEIDYWRKLEQTNVVPISKCFMPEIDTCSNERIISIELQKEKTHYLLSEANKAYNTEINDILLTALGLAVNEWSGNKKVLICMEGHGRESIVGDLNISNTIGWFTSLYPVAMDIEESRSISDTIKLIKENLRGIPNKGFGYGVLKYITSHNKKEGLKFDLNLEIKFNYLGRFDENNGIDLFEVLPITAGRNTSNNLRNFFPLEIDGIVFNDIMKFNFSFDSSKFKENEILRLARLYEGYLSDIIDHCVMYVKNGKFEYTPADFGEKELSIEELNEINNLISSIAD